MIDRFISTYATILRFLGSLALPVSLSRRLRRLLLPLALLSSSRSDFQSVPFEVNHSQVNGSWWLDPHNLNDLNGNPITGSATFLDALGRTIAADDPIYNPPSVQGIACSPWGAVSPPPSPTTAPTAAPPPRNGTPTMPVAIAPCAARRVAARRASPPMPSARKSTPTAALAPCKATRSTTPWPGN